MLQKSDLMSLAQKYGNSLDCLALLADIGAIMRKSSEASETLKRLQSEVNELKKIVSN